ncbi:MAG: sodium-independent anion transporter, partial [Acetobacteraceae bacterium]|nr:sodium-independent anion transporter [Acetobacteraceae bacterium]
GEHVPGVLVFAPAAPLNFTNAAFVRNRLREALAHAGALHLVVIEASGVTEIDYTGSVVLQDIIANLHAGGTEVALARLSGERAQVQAARTGVLAAIGPGHVFRTVEEAVRAYAQNTQLPLPLRAWAAERTKAGGRGPGSVPLDPSPHPPPSRGGGDAQPRG